MLNIKSTKSKHALLPAYPVERNPPPEPVKVISMPDPMYFVSRWKLEKIFTCADLKSMHTYPSMQIAAFEF